MSEHNKLCDLVTDFSDRMREKLLEKLDEGWEGWDDADAKMEFEDRLIAHVVSAMRGEEGEWVDVANFAAFLDRIESGVSKPTWKPCR